MSNSLWPHGLHSSWNSPGQNTGVLSLSLLQGIFSTQRLNPGFLHCKRILSQHRKHDFKRIHILHRIKFLWGNTCIFSYILKVEFLLYIDHFKKIMKSFLLTEHDSHRMRFQVKIKNDVFIKHYYVPKNFP